jgi:hypothetical protein
MTIYADEDAHCRALYERLLDRIHRGAGIYHKDALYRSILADIEAYEDACSQAMAAFLRIALEHFHNRAEVPVTIEQCDALAERAGCDLTRYYCVTLRASLSIKTEAEAANSARREEAIAIARRHGWTELELRALVNWTFMLLEAGNLARSAEVLAEATHLASDPAARDYVALGLRSRLKAHEARLVARTDAGPDVLARIDALYREAFDIVAEEDHLRTNCAIEWAAELARLVPATAGAALARANEALVLAERSLDTHLCDFCRAYFHRIEGEVLLATANAKALVDPPGSVVGFKAARTAFEASVGLYAKTDHPQLAGARDLLEDCERTIVRMTIPADLFLSHKGADKELVRRFHKTLKQLGYLPWLDEDVLVAGVPLDRGLLKGIKGSCAAIFFITPEFLDEGFLAAEVDYAIQEQRARPDSFAIIPLVFRDAAGNTGVVPELLRRFVYKHPADELEALCEIVRAVPLTLPPPRWIDPDA